jgi:arsenate reductase
MAAAFFNRLADPELASAASAGTAPGAVIHPEVAEVMLEVGIDLSGTTPQKLTPQLAQGAAHLITMGCGESCPVVPGARVHDWPVEDPKGKSAERVRQIRDEIGDRVARFVTDEGWAATASS